MLFLYFLGLITIILLAYTWISCTGLYRERLEGGGI